MAISFILFFHRPHLTKKCAKSPDGVGGALTLPKEPKQPKPPKVFAPVDEAALDELHRAEFERAKTSEYFTIHYPGETGGESLPDRMVTPEGERPVRWAVGISREQERAQGACGYSTGETENRHQNSDDPNNVEDIRRKKVEAAQPIVEATVLGRAKRRLAKLASERAG